MKRPSKALLQIGEVTKALGITRKTLLVYEEAGLLTPAYKDEESGYRYYSADNMTEVRAIRVLQQLGLSLKEVAGYYSDTENLDIYLERLVELRDTLDRNIELLRSRSAKHGDLSVHLTRFPRQFCFCRRYRCKTVADAIEALREIYVDAVHTGPLSLASRMFTMRMPQAAEGLDLMCCIPMEKPFDGPECREFPPTAALCIYFRGPYEDLSSAMRVLGDYVKEHNISVTGPIRAVYLEGPPNRGANRDDYITQVAVPIKA